MTAPMSVEAALEALRAHEEPGRAEGSTAYHKVDRTYLGVPNPAVNDLTTEWRRELSLEDRVALADGLWATDIHEARIAAAKLLTQARIKGDAPVWDLLASWVPQFDAWAIADHACSAIGRRLQADLTRLDDLEAWTVSDHMWTRRAALVSTLFLTKSNHPSEAEAAARDRVLDWAGGYVSDRDWFIQKAIAWWLRELSKHDAARVRAFLAEYGSGMKAFARKEAGKYLSD
ncbi:DNA alkylation repair protein [Pseudooceanicola onchidii]|uniref:DNA alkylation repair protein n=1 Tax=Pseudooceanicola onchidii TaxID=2562279 RepID=UPI001F0E03D6|nr:DNA alkylation repair protein [Pseudooceanicola onchidii]